jgi:hypothetical protein
MLHPVIVNISPHLEAEEVVCQLIAVSSRARVYWYRYNIDDVGRKLGESRLQCQCGIHRLKVEK